MFCLVALIFLVWLPANTFELVFSVPTEHKRGPRTSHIQIWAYRLIPIRITIIAIAVAAFVNFEAIQITWLRGFSLFLGSSKSFNSPSSDTTVYRQTAPATSLDIVYFEQRRSDTIDKKSVALVYGYGPEALFSGWIRRWDMNNAVARMQDLSDREASSKLRWSRSFRLLSSAFFFATLTI